MARDGDGRTHAAIDIGTNSIHLLVARTADDGGLVIVTREKEPVRLGSGAGEMEVLGREAIERGIAALRRFKAVAEAHGADVTAVATSAVREAANRQEFLRRARDEAGVTIDVVSGVEEARLIQLGVLQSLPVFDERILMVDIGGGSTELLVGKGGRVIDALSVKLGAIRLTDRFFPRGKIRPGAVDDCRAYVRSYLAPALGRLRPLGHDVAVGSSGTITTIAAIVQGRRGVDPGRSVNGASFGPRDLADAIDALTSATEPGARRVDGLDAKRQDIIVGGALLLEQVVDLFDVSKMVVSEYALREGLFLDRHRRSGTGSLGHLEDIRRESARRILQRFPDDADHVRHSTRLALQLFDELHGVHGLGEPERLLLEVAGLLHNVGLVVSHAAHHKHSYYVIRHTDQLLGFTDREVEMVAQVARYHRRSEPSERHPEHAALAPADRRVVALLAGLLRVGIALDRGHTGTVETVRASVGADGVVLETDAGSPPELEVYTADQRKGLLERELGRTIRFAAA